MFNSIVRDSRFSILIICWHSQLSFSLQLVSCPVIHTRRSKTPSDEIMHRVISSKGHSHCPIILAPFRSLAAVVSLPFRTSFSGLSRKVFAASLVSAGSWIGQLFQRTSARFRVLTCFSSSYSNLLRVAYSSIISSRDNSRHEPGGEIRGRCRHPFSQRFTCTEMRLWRIRHVDGADEFLDALVRQYPYRQRKLGVTTK